MNFFEEFSSEVEKVAASAVSPIAENFLYGPTGAQRKRRYGLDPVDKRKLTDPWKYGIKRQNNANVKLVGQQNQKLKDVFQEHKKRKSSPTSFKQKAIDTGGQVLAGGAVLGGLLGISHFLPGGIRSVLKSTGSQMRSATNAWRSSAGMSGGAATVGKANQMYKALGLKSNATNAEIKSAYRKMAKQWHPDVNKSPQAVSMSKKINEAQAYFKSMGKYGSLFDVAFINEINKDAKMTARDRRDRRDRIRMAGYGTVGAFSGAALGHIPHIVRSVKAMRRFHKAQGPVQDAARAYDSARSPLFSFSRPDTSRVEETLKAFKRAVGENLPKAEKAVADMERGPGAIPWITGAAGAGAGAGAGYMGSEKHKRFRKI